MADEQLVHLTYYEQVPLTYIVNIWLLLALYNKHKALYTTSVTMGLFH